MARREPCLPLHGGVQLTTDTTMVLVHFTATAPRDEEQRKPTELLCGPQGGGTIATRNSFGPRSRAQFVVLAVEVGGLQQLANARARSGGPLFRRGEPCSLQRPLRCRTCTTTTGRTATRAVHEVDGDHLMNRACSWFAPGCRCPFKKKKANLCREDTSVCNDAVGRSYQNCVAPALLRCLAFLGVLS